jgi:hypothetical protein
VTRVILKLPAAKPSDILRITARLPESYHTFCLPLLAMVASCHTTRPQPLAGADYPGTLFPPSVLATEAAWQQTVTATWQIPGQPTKEQSFLAALQRQGDQLTVVGLSPMGTVGFFIKHSPNNIEMQNNMRRELAIPPRFILLDIQRAFYPWLGKSLDNGERVGPVAGEEVIEVWDGQRIQERSFRRLDKSRTGLITVSYEWGKDNWALPKLALIKNGWLDYQLRIVTHSETRLPEQNLDPAKESQ